MDLVRTFAASAGIAVFAFVVVFLGHADAVKI
jgi:hypothetical protein